MDESRQVVLEFGQGAGAPAPGVPVDPVATFVASDRIVMSPDTARRLVDGLARALGRPLAPVAGAAASMPQMLAATR